MTELPVVLKWAIVVVFSCCWLAAALGAGYGHYWTFAGRLLYALAWQIVAVSTAALLFPGDTR